MTSEEKPATGTLGRAITPMLPSGKVLIDGDEYNARVQQGWVDKDEDVVVVGFDTFGLIVGKPESQES